jgi:hypothetical protein
LPFTDFRRVCTTRSQCNYLQYNFDTDSGEGGQSVGAKVGLAGTWVSSPGDEMVRSWPHVTPVGALGNQVPELHGIGRPALVGHKFNSHFYYCLVLWEWKSIDVSWELPVKIAAP